MSGRQASGSGLGLFMMAVALPADSPVGVPPGTRSRRTTARPGCGFVRGPGRRAGVIPPTANLHSPDPDVPWTS